MYWIVNLVLWKVLFWPILFNGIKVEEYYGCNHQEAHNPHFPVSSDAIDKYGAKIALAAKFRENCPCCSSPTKLKVNYVGGIDHNAHDVDDQEYDFDNALIFDSVSCF